MNIPLQSPDKEVVFQAFHNEVWIMNVEPLRCTEHQGKAGCIIEDTPGSGLRVDLSVCCDNFADRVIKECRKGLDFRNKTWESELNASRS